MPSKRMIAVHPDTGFHGDHLRQLRLYPMDSIALTPELRVKTGGSSHKSSTFEVVATSGSSSI